MRVFLNDVSARSRSGEGGDLQMRGQHRIGDPEITCAQYKLAHKYTGAQRRVGRSWAKLVKHSRNCVFVMRQL